ncbi:MAG: glycosyl transferase, partial [Lactobacillus porci]|nr:glycosyl transferase [Lactobacillus porci]
MEMSRKKKIFYILAIALSVLYLLWRIIFTIPWRAKPWVLVFALTLWICEVVSASTAYITIIFRLITKKDDEREATPPFLTGERDVPDVDVLIATHNEDVDLLKKTVNGAVLMEYPEGKKHIYICDDGNRP